MCNVSPNYEWSNTSLAPSNCLALDSLFPYRDSSDSNHVHEHQPTSKLKGLGISRNNISQFVRYYKESSTASQVKVRLECLDLLGEHIIQTIWEIESHDDYEEEEGFEKEQLEYENRY